MIAHSHPKEFQCRITPRSAKAAALIHVVDEEHPLPRSDAPALAGAQWVPRV